MAKTPVEVVKQQSHQILAQWLTSCTRGGNVARNTIAIGIVVLDHLRRRCPVSRAAVLSQGGEVKGARSGLGPILEAYGIPNTYLREVTTRQGHQDGQRLLEQFEWGEALTELPNQERENLLVELTGTLVTHANIWLRRQNLKLQIDRRQSPMAWVHMILESARQRSSGIVEQHLAGAKLERRFKDVPVPNHPAHAGDVQTAREGDFVIAKLVCHVTAAPSPSVIRKCAANIKRGLHPLLLIPSEQENKARVLAQVENIDQELTIISIEAFVSVNIIELATKENKDFFSVLQEIIQIYNRRLTEVETDLSLQIQLS